MSSKKLKPVSGIVRHIEENKYGEKLRQREGMEFRRTEAESQRDH